MDARYCSAACRNAAQRQRKREEKIRKRAQTAVQQAAAESAAAAESRRLQHLRELFIEQLQGQRSAAQCPSLQIDPWLQGHAALRACELLIAQLQKLLERIRGETTKHPKPPLEIKWQVYGPRDVPQLPRRVSHVGAAVLPDFADGHVVLLYAQRPEPANKKSAADSEASTERRAVDTATRRPQPPQDGQAEPTLDLAKLTEVLSLLAPGFLAEAPKKSGSSK